MSWKLHSKWGIPRVKQTCTSNRIISAEEQEDREIKRLSLQLQNIFLKKDEDKTHSISGSDVMWTTWDEDKEDKHKEYNQDWSDYNHDKI